MFPYRPDCGYLGWSQLDSTPGTVWINGILYGAIAAHEIGYNFGLEHSSSQPLCTKAQLKTIYNSCVPDEYGDPVDVTAHSFQHDFNAWDQYQLGLLGSNDVKVVTKGGTYPLIASESASHTTPRLLLVPSHVASENPMDPKGTHVWLALDLREVAGTFDTFAPTDPVVNGVSIRRVQMYLGDRQSFLLDRTPTSTADAPYPGGSVFRGTADKVTIRVISAGHGKAVVQVGF